MARLWVGQTYGVFYLPGFGLMVPAPWLLGTQPLYIGINYYNCYFLLLFIYLFIYYYFFFFFILLENPGKPVHVQRHYQSPLLVQVN